MLKRPQYLFIIAAIVLFFGDCLPWVEARMVSVNGLDTDDGTLMLFLALGILVAAVITMRKVLLGAIFGALISAAAFFVGIYDIGQASATRHTGLGDIHTNAGVGLFICLFGAMVGLYAAYVGLQSRTTVRV